MRGHGSLVADPRQMPRSRFAHRLVALTALVVSTAAWSAGAASAATSDTDGDSLTDAYEREWTKTSPTRRDSDGDGVVDGTEDLDADRLTNLQEQTSRTRPRTADSDGDGTRDDREDADADGLWNWSEFRAVVHPRVTDTDGDGVPTRARIATATGSPTSTSRRAARTPPGPTPTTTDTVTARRSAQGRSAQGRQPPDRARRRVPVPAGSTVLPDPPRRQRLEHPHRRTRGRLELLDDDRGDRPRPWPAHGLRLVRGLWHPVPGRLGIDGPVHRDLRVRRRVGPRRLSDPGLAAHRGRSRRRRRPPHPDAGQGQLPPVRAVRGDPRGRCLACR